jgi:hypothetical protein
MEMKNEQMLYELIIRRLDAIDRKCDRLIDDVDEIKKSMDDTEPATSQWFGGGAQ